MKRRISRATMLNRKKDISTCIRICQTPTILKRKLCKRHNLPFICVILVVMLYYLGTFSHWCELSYDNNFNYPLKGNIVDCVNALAAHKRLNRCEIINAYNHTFLVENKDKCVQSNNGTIQLVLIVKSAINNFERRLAIRNTWGNENRFYDVNLKRIFILGTTFNNSAARQVLSEQAEFGDIVQADFLDTYYNNTIKTMNAFKWAFQHCDAKFYLLGDDDMYISIKNVLRFIRNPTEYPQYLERGKDKEVSKYLNQITHYELPDNVKLYAGFVYGSNAPHRHQCSKWYVTLDEYPYDKWPPYIPAGSYIVSRETLKLMYYGSFFTQHFRFDDIYLAIIAKKLDIEPFHSYEFHMYKEIANDTNFKYVISSHGYQSQQLIDLWNKQKALGNA